MTDLASDILLPIESVLSGFRNAAGRDYQASDRNDYRALRYQESSALYAIVNPDAIAGDPLRFSYFCHKKFRHTRNVDHRNGTHSNSPQPKVRLGESTTATGHVVAFRTQFEIEAVCPQVCRKGDDK